MSGDASWWTSVVDGLPAAGTRVLCLTEEGRVVILDTPRRASLKERFQWFDDREDSGRVIAWAHVPHVEFKALCDKFLEAQDGD